MPPYHLALFYPLIIFATAMFEMVYPPEAGYHPHPLYPSPKGEGLVPPSFEGEGEESLERGLRPLSNL
jgi:hypothetical protein